MELHGSSFVEPWKGCSVNEDHTPERYCHECKLEFDNSFDLIDHLLPEDEEFDPYYVLPSGMKLMLGTMMRYLFAHAQEPARIEKLAQSTYITLFASEMQYEDVEELVQDMVVSQEMHDIDSELEQLLRNKDDNEGGA